MSYKQLTKEERYTIYGLLQGGFSQKDIARKLRRHPSTICREIARNKGQRGYRSKQAQNRTEQRIKTSQKAIKMTKELKHTIIMLLKLQWSPEQIAGWLKRKKQPTVSHERIYQFIWHDRRLGGHLYIHLRRSIKKYKKRYAARDNRGRIPNRTSIENRPPIVDAKKRYGDWEADTLIGKRHKSGLVTMVERKSKLTRLGKINRPVSALKINPAIKKLIPKETRQTHTITVDNGHEFADHQRLAQDLGVAIFFCHPYHAWERGLNENTNGLVRQYFPKQTDFRVVSTQYIKRVEWLLNTRPRKSLGYRSPYELYYQRTIKNIALVS